MRSHAAISLLLALSLSPALSFGWGPEAHEIIGDIARVHLTPQARGEVKALLGNDDLAAISVWADEVRHDRPETYGWHFVDIPADSSGFEERRDCYRPDPKHRSSLEDHHNCVVDRITMFRQVLADRSRAKEERVEALKFLVHFVGDIHQPMHAIGEARGGNDIHVIEFRMRACGEHPCNLHFAWDAGLIDHTGLSEEQYVRRITPMIAREKLGAGWAGTPAAWANESFRLAKQVWLNDGGRVDDEYYRKNLPVVDRRLELAGLRLAVLLNQALSK